MNDYTLSDLAAATGGGNGFGDGNGAWWLLVLFALLGGFGNRGIGGGTGGNDLYPWLNQSQQVNDGFRDQMMNTTVNGIQQAVNALSTQLCNCCSDMQMTTAQGFNQTQMGVMQGFNSLQSQLADCCCENRLATANQTATILAENCADRAAISDGVRDIIASQTAGTQRILDQLCADKIDAKNDEIAQLRQQLNMQSLAASQAAQNAFIQQGFSNEVDALYDRLSNCPVPSMPVYGRTPIFTCPSQNGCGCN